MQRRISSFALLTTVSATAVALLVWYRASSPVSMPVVQAAALTAAPRQSPVAAPPDKVAAPAPSAPTDEAVAQWIADTSSGDASKRAAAITALAEAPKVQALPVLRHLLTDGEPQVDRSLALRSLRDLALNQGDSDGAIREAVRNAIYHGDDFTKTEEVQDVLDIIEESEHH